MFAAKDNEHSLTTPSSHASAMTTPCLQGRLYLKHLSPFMEVPFLSLPFSLVALSEDTCMHALLGPHATMALRPVPWP